MSACRSGATPPTTSCSTDPNVSRFHAELVRDGDAIELIDMGSRNGTRLDGEPVARHRLETGSEIGIGPYRLVFDGASLIARDDHGALRLDATRVAMSVSGKQILEPTSLSIEPGELVAIIGESGAGKSTLLKALAGVTRPTSGRVTVNGEDLLGRLTDVGYVPQDDIVHPLLTVREALGYAARLRLPEDVSDEEIDAAVARVLGELSLAEHAETMIGSLSGGQRKRTGVATELLNRPSVLFLDEPTTGLDPGLETQMMKLFRELSRGGRAIAIVTHATKNLALCDRVVVMGRGGVLTFDGPPAAALEFFGVGDYDGIYAALPDKAAGGVANVVRVASGGPRSERGPAAACGRGTATRPGAAPAPGPDGSLPAALRARPAQPAVAARPGTGAGAVRRRPVRERDLRPRAAATRATP